MIMHTMSKPVSETLLLDVNDMGIARITINRPDKLNALNSSVLRDLDEAIHWVENDSSVRAVLLTGSGDKAFVAGADIGEFSSLDRSSGEKLSKKGQDLLMRIEQSSRPWVAAVNGYALGGGAELAMACHLRVGAPNAVFGLPEVSLGLIPGYGGTQRLPYLIGRSRAMEMIMTGRQMKAEEAYHCGLLHVLSHDGALFETAEQILLKVLKNSPIAVRHAVQAILHSGESDGYTREASLFGDLCQTDDFREGVEAFLQKRKPEFKGN